ncbi:MAG: beta-lactamase family protein [Thermomicrobiales bacterium]|nr:beta-lactamase family protein [Thermomicrobiales bacterium]
MPDDSALTAALEAIDQQVTAWMAPRATPGLALAITDREGLLATRSYGLADLAAQTPVTPETWFQHGSIGKSFSAIVTLQLVAEGVLDLQAPVTRYLPWFAVGGGHEPITLHHLLTHTSGLPAGTDFSPDQRYEIWALRDVPAAAPGSRTLYSNVGYRVLGLVLEAVTGQSYADMVTQRILRPLGMRDTSAVIDNAMRHRQAVAYIDYFNDRPWRPEHGFAPAPWFETNSADGCLAGTAADLAAYLRMLLNGGVGPQGRLLSPEGFALLTAPHTAFDWGSYGYGLIVGERNGREFVGHEGGMVGFIAAMFGDVPSGLGVVMFTNSGQDLAEIASHVLATLVAAREGHPLPALPAAPEIDLAAYTGTYRSGDEAVSAEVAAGQLVLTWGEARLTLDPQGVPPEPDHFLAAQPGYDRFPFHFQRDEGRITELAHGSHWFPAEGAAAPVACETPAAWAAYPGHYRSHNPWNPGFRVVLRQGALWLVNTWGESRLIPDGEAFIIDDEPEGPERFIFDTIIDGQAWRVGSPGGEMYYRFFTE